MAERPEPNRGRESETATWAIPTHRQVLSYRLRVHTWVRALVAVVIASGAVLARYVLEMDGIDVVALTTLAIVIGAYDAAIWALARRHRDPVDYPNLLRLGHAAAVLDLIALTCLIWWVGGGRSPFVAFYLLHVAISSMLLSRRAAIAVAGLSYGLLALLVLVEWSGVATPPMPAGAVAGSAPLEGLYAATTLGVHGVLFGLTLFLLLGMTGALRKDDRRIRLANDELTRLSEQRRGFMHIAMHNLKAPLGAVSMFLGNMRDGLAGPLEDKQRDWIDRSLRRLEGVNEFMVDMQTLSSLEHDIIQAEFISLDLVRIVKSIVGEYRDVAESHRHSLTLDVKPPIPPVVGYDRLLREAMTNYLTNAIKYTPDGGKIVLRVLARHPWVRVEVEDNGIGVSPADQTRLFREFMRIQTKGTEVSAVKGSGLGLSIVKRIISAHGGRTGVESREGRGSTFYFELPSLSP